VTNATLALLLVMCALSVAVHGQEPRLPVPSSRPAASEALIQRAQMLAGNRSFRESATTWQSIAVREPSIAALAQREAIRAFVAEGDLDAAMTTLSQMGTAAPVELLLRVADAQRSAGAFDRAVPLYRRARVAAGRTPAADEAALGLAGTLEQNGQAREALATYRSLQTSFRQAAAFETADLAARRLSAQLGGSPLTESDYQAIVSRLVDVAAFRRAVDTQAEWLERFPDTAQREAVEAAMVVNLYALRANDEARKRALSFLKQRPDSLHAHDVVITLFRLHVREGRTADVETLGRAITNGDVAGAAIDDRRSAARLLAEYLVSIGQPAKAHAVYSQLLAMTPARGARIEVLWRMAIASLRNGNAPRATKELQQALRLKPDRDTGRAVSFWLAHSLAAVGSTGEARTRWASIAERESFTYYGRRAAARLGRTPDPALAFPQLSLSDVPLAHPHYQAAALLSKAGLLSDAAVYARRLSDAFRRDAAVALLAARASAAAGDHTSASALIGSYFGRFLEQSATGVPDDFWSLAYPRAYWPEVSNAASRHKVDPLLMLGLARQESHFDRTARSSVGAVGLFQVMPYTAAELDPSFTAPEAMVRLLQADTSADLAARLIGGLLERFQKSLAPTIASYNADRERVQVWWEASKGISEELFIDSIPYQQTRMYVRQVMANYAMYQRSAPSASPGR